MNARHVTESLPLWVGGDLSAGEAREVEQHLAACEACRVAAEALRQSRGWIREGADPPFSAEEREALRRETMARIRSAVASYRTPSGRSARPWLLVAAALLAAVGAYRWIRPAANTARILPAPPRTFTARIAPIPSAPPSVSHRRPTRPRHQPSGPQAPEEVAFSRLELQTSDPTVRIIWLACATPVPALPEPSNP